MTYGVTPVSGFAPPVDEGFPRFIQFQLNGTNVGGTVVQTVNFVGDVDLSLSSDEGTLTVDIAPRPFEWVPVPGDYTLQITDALNGLRCEGGSGTQVIYVPPDEDVPFEAGDEILVFVAGDAGVSITPLSSVALLYRSALTNQAAGQFATMSLIKDIEPNTWILCGDLAYAET